MWVKMLGLSPACRMRGARDRQTWTRLRRGRGRARFHLAGCSSPSLARGPGADHPCRRHYRLEPHHLAKLETAARHAAIIRSGNMSLGVNLLAGLVRRSLRRSTRIGISRSRDASPHEGRCPSGTAVMLGEAAAAGREVDLARAASRPRRAYTARDRRRRSALRRCAAARSSAIKGHLRRRRRTARISHIAQDRGLFAQGAVKAAFGRQNREHGLYSMSDVLGLDGL